MSFAVRRHALGIIALLLIAAAGVLLLGVEGDGYEVAGSLCWRSGLLLGALWLALPQVLSIVSGCPPRLVVAIFVGMGILVVRFKLLPLVALGITLVAILEYGGRLLKKR